MLENLPIATQMAESVICLPMHHDLADGDIARIVNTIIK